MRIQWIYRGTLFSDKPQMVLTFLPMLPFGSMMFRPCKCSLFGIDSKTSPTTQFHEPAQRWLPGFPKSQVLWGGHLGRFGRLAHYALWCHQDACDDGDTGLDFRRCPAIRCHHRGYGAFCRGRGKKCLVVLCELRVFRNLREVEIQLSTKTGGMIRFDEQWWKRWRMTWMILNDDVLNVIVCLPILGKRPKEGRSGDKKKNRLGLYQSKSCSFATDFGYPLVISHSYWKWPFIVDFPIKNGDFPLLC